MRKYLIFDIIHSHGAGIYMAIPDGVDNAEAVAEEYLNDLYNNNGLLDVPTDYLETELDFAEETSAKDFEYFKNNGLFTLEPTLDELKPFLDAKPSTATYDRWVSVENHLPPHDARLLVYANGIVNIDNYSTKNGFACEQDNKNHDNKVFVTHWQLIRTP